MTTYESWVGSGGTEEEQHVSGNFQGQGMTWYVMERKTHPVSSKSLEGRDYILLVGCYILWA